MSIYLGDTPLAHNAVSRNIGEIIQSTIPLSDAGLHLLDGALISSAGSYAKFVNYIAGLVSNYPDLFTTESNWQSSVSTYGVCGKFVYDSTNNTVRLPKITGFTEGTTDVTALGDLIEAGLPNITGSVPGSRDSTNTKTGVFSGSNIESSSYTGHSSSSGYRVSSINFSAQDSNSIYGNSSTVQPQTIKVLYYIVIANSIKTNIEVDIDEIATDLNGKADVDLSNVNASGTSLASSWSMPSTRYENLTLGASDTTYTAPANGWVMISKKTTAANQYVELGIASDGWVRFRDAEPSSSATALTSCPVRKGVNFYCVYTAGGTLNFFRFIYAEGEV